MALSPLSRPKLASKARLRWDKREEKHLLLYPERGLLLNATATEIVRACTGEQTIAGIVTSLLEKYPGKAREELEAEVMRFLDQMVSRGLVQVES